MAGNHRSHPMGRQMAAPLPLNPTTIGVKEEEEDKRARGGVGRVDAIPRLWPWGEPWVPQGEENAPMLPPPPAGRCPRSVQLIKREWKPKNSRVMPPAKERWRTTGPFVNFLPWPGPKGARPCG